MIGGRACCRLVQSLPRARLLLRPRSPKSPDRSETTESFEGVVQSHSVNLVTAVRGLNDRFYGPGSVLKEQRMF